MREKKILLVEDDTDVITLLETELRSEGYEVVSVSDAVAALATFRGDEFALVVLDISLAKAASSFSTSDDGMEVLKKIRAESAVPIIMLTETDVEIVKVLALTLGADDYVTKPFSPREVSARVGAVLRRGRHATAGNISLLGGRLEIDRSARIVTKDGRQVDLTPTEFDLLSVLADSPGIALSRQRLLDRLRSVHYFGDERVIDVHVRHLREKIEDDPSRPRLIVTVRAVGYRIDVPSEGS